MNFSSIFNNIIGQTNHFSIEKRIFHSALMFSILISFLFLIESLIYSFRSFIISLLLINIVVFCLLYIISRFDNKKQYPVWLYLAINFIIIDIDWLFIGGIQGISRPLLVVFALITPLMVGKKHLVAGNIVFALFYIQFIALTHIFYDRISLSGLYPQIIKEGVIETGMLSIFVIVLGNRVVSNFFSEKKTITNLNESLLKANNEIQEKNHLLKQVDETRNNFYSMIAHDLRGPIGTMSTLNKHILSEFSSLKKDEAINLLSLLAESSKNTYSLLEDLLLWSQSNNENISVKITKIELHNLVNSVIELLRPGFIEKDIQIETDLTPQTIYSDKNIIQTIIRNLLSNALKFTPSGKKITVRIENNWEFLAVEVADEGLGMTKEKLDKLFKQENIDSIRGNGLGLILCQELSEKIGGEISATSIINKGSRFKMKLPRDYCLVHPIRYIV